MNSDQLINRFVTDIMNPALLVLFATGLFFFTWGLFQFMRAISDSNGTKIDEGKGHMLWGMVGMVIMVSVYGIVNIIGSTFGLAPFSPSTPNLNSNNLPALQLTNV